MKNIAVFLLFAIAFLQLNCKNPVGDERPEYTITYSELYSVNADGTNLLQLTKGKNFIHYADFIPNSDKIFFVQTGIGFNGEHLTLSEQIICTMDLTTGVVDTLVQANIYQNIIWVNESSEDIPRSVVCSPDGKKLYFAGRLPEMTSERKDIFSVDLQTKQITNLTNTPDGYAVGHFRLSFDGNKIIYTDFLIGNKNRHLKTMNINDNSKSLILESESVDFLYPQLLSNNKKIVFIERNQNDYSKTSLVEIYLDSLIKKYIKNIRPSFLFFPEINIYHDIVIDDFNDSIASPVRINLESDVKNNLGMSIYAKPFFTKNGAELLYFDTKWHLKKVAIDGSITATILNRAEGRGTTHIPQQSMLNSKIIFINKDVIAIRSGDTK